MNNNVTDIYNHIRQAEEVIAAASARVQDYLKALKETGNSTFEVEGEYKQVRTFTDKETGAVTYKLVNLTCNPADRKDRAKERALEAYRAEVEAKLRAAGVDLSVLEATGTDGGDITIG